MSFDFTKLVGLIPDVVDLVVLITNQVKPQVDEARWKELGPDLRDLITAMIEGRDLTHNEVMGYIPDKKKMELYADVVHKRAARVAAGLPIVGSLDDEVDS